MSLENVQYLGDGVYVQHETETQQIILTVGSHVIASSDHIIFIDINTLHNFQQWLERHNFISKAPAHD